MATTVKRASIGLTKETLKQLDYLKKELGENTSQVVKRAIQELYSIIKAEYTF